MVPIAAAEYWVCARCHVVMRAAKSSRMGVSTRRLRAISPVDLSNRNRAINKSAMGVAWVLLKIL